jgi:two-component system NtrC family sensor kinase
MKSLGSTKDANPSINEFLLLDRSGKVAASSDEGSIGSDRSADSFFLGAREGPSIKDAYYAPGRNKPLMAVSMPLSDVITGRFLGVLVAIVQMKDLDDMVMHRAGMGRSGEVYIVNKYGYMITPSLFKENVVLRQRADPVGSEQTARFFPNYRGAYVLRAIAPVPQMHWSVFAEIDASEALEPLVRMREAFFTILFIAPFIAWILGVSVAATITRPIKRLQKGVTIIGSGKLDYKVGTASNDEIGQLSRAFDAMTRNLKTTTTSMTSLNKEVEERKSAEEKIRAQAKELSYRLEELKRTQDMLVQSAKLASLGTLASEIAHEINNPLMIISGNAQLSMMIEPLDIEVKNNLKTIIEECQRAKGIIHRILKFAKPSRGEMKETDMIKSLESLILIVEKPFQLAGITIKRRYPKKAVVMAFDEQHMHEVFLNLLNNAKEAMPGGGVVTVTAAATDTHFTVDFRDTGPGIPEAARDKIFEPFFTTKEKGTGLGLSICYGIIKAHDGDIRFTTEAGRGTTFTLTLPLK